MQCLDCTGADGHNCGNSASQRLCDDQPIGLNARRQHQQVGDSPLLIQRLVDKYSGHCDPLCQSCRSDLGPDSSRVIRISAVRADQLRCPRKVSELRQRAD